MFSALSRKSLAPYKWPKLHQSLKHINHHIKGLEPRQTTCSVCLKRYSSTSNLERHKVEDHALQSKRAAKAAYKEFFQCSVCPDRKYFAWRRYREHMKQVHEEVVQNSNIKATVQPLKEPNFAKKKRIDKKKVVNSKKICISGKIGDARPLLQLFLEKKGFNIVDKPVQGMNSVVYGESYTCFPQDIMEHYKIKQAQSLGINIIPIDVFLKNEFNITIDQADQKLQRIRGELRGHNGGINNDVQIITSSGMPKFVILSVWAWVDLSGGKLCSDSLLIKGKSLLQYINPMMKYWQVKSLEIYTSNETELYKFIGILRLKGDMVKYRLFETKQKAPYREVPLTQIVALPPIINNRKKYDNQWREAQKRIKESLDFTNNEQIKDQGKEENEDLMLNASETDNYLPVQEIKQVQEEIKQNQEEVKDSTVPQNSFLYILQQQCKKLKYIKEVQEQSKARKREILEYNILFSSESIQRDALYQVAVIKEEEKTQRKDELKKEIEAFQYRKRFVGRLADWEQRKLMNAYKELRQL